MIVIHMRIVIISKKLKFFVQAFAKKMDQSSGSFSTILAHLILVGALLVSMQLVLPSEGIHIELSNQYQQPNTEQNTNSVVSTTEPYIISSATAQAATRNPKEHRTYEAMIDHLKQLERAPEAFANVIERLRDTLKRFVDRIKPKGHQQQSLDSFQDSDGADRDKKLVIVDDESKQQTSGGLSTIISRKGNAEKEAKTTGNEEKEASKEVVESSRMK